MIESRATSKSVSFLVTGGTAEDVFRESANGSLPVKGKTDNDDWNGRKNDRGHDQIPTVVVDDARTLPSSTLPCSSDRKPSLPVICKIQTWAIRVDSKKSPDSCSGHGWGSCATNTRCDLVAPSVRERLVNCQRDRLYGSKSCPVDRSHQQRSDSVVNLGTGISRDVCTALSSEMEEFGRNRRGEEETLENAA